jgi:TrkA domain protein
MPSISESNLPGVGRKFQIEATSGDKLTIVIHDDGRRELYHFTREKPEKVASVVTLHDAEARQIAGIIGGLTYVPKALPTAELVLDDLVLEWYTIAAKANCVGKTIRDLMVRTVTGASIVSIIEENRTKLINPEADTRLNAGATLIIAGDRKTIGALKLLLEQGRGG